MAQTYNSLYLEARGQLRRAGITSAQLEATELLCFATGKTKAQFYRDMQLYASDELETRIRELVNRRLAGEPVAYLTGEWDFCGLTLDISRDVLIPRDDTAILAERAAALTAAAGSGARALDLCAGSGCVGLFIAARVPESRVVLADWSEEALRVSRQNVRRHNLNARVTCLLADAMAPPPSSLWDFDVIACNPPYIRTADLETLDKSVGFEPRMALDGGEDGLDFYRAIAAKWQASLRLGGVLLFEVGIGQASEVERILAQNGFEKIRTHADLQGIWRVVEGTAGG